jgi:ATP-dependent Zn protease
MDNYHRARTLIQEREHLLHNLANALLEKETLDAADIDAIINPQPALA